MGSGPTSGTIFFQIGILVLLTIINAFFAGAEMAIVSVNKNKIRLLAEAGNKKAVLVEQLFENSTKFLSTIQVAITFASFFSGAAAASGIAVVFGDWIAIYNIPYSKTIATVAITLINAYVNLVFGELVPKRIALQKAETFSLFVVKPICAISKVLSPFIKLLSLSTNGVLRLLGMKADNLEENVTEEEIKSMLKTGSEAGVFNNIETDMINSIFSFDDKAARDIIVPRKDVLAMDINEPFEEQFDEILESRHSRIPVYEDTVDNIIGILDVKDFLIYYKGNGWKDIDLKSILKKPYYVPEGKPIDILFLEMQKSKNRMAILIDEYGGFSGIVTIEDLVEEIVGDINEEYEEDETVLEKVGDNEYIINGSMPLESLNNKLGLEIFSENYDTISGFIIELLGYVPEEDDRSEVEDGNVVFKIEAVMDKRIYRIRVKIKPIDEQ